MIRRGLCLGILVALWPLVAQGKVEMVVRPAVAPSWANSLKIFSDNVMKALAQGKSAVGNPVYEPTAFNQVDEIVVGQLIASSFASWSGVANPKANKFRQEHGNRLHFCLRILGHGQKIRLADLAFDLRSEDALGAMNEQGDFKSATYSMDRRGIDYGEDGKPDTNDDQVYKDHEPSMLPVDEIRYLGVGIGMAPAKVTGKQSGPQAQIDGVIRALMGTQASFDLKMTYTLRAAAGEPGEAGGTGGEDASVSVNVHVRPQPAVVLIGPQPESIWPLFFGVGGGLVVALVVSAVRKVRRQRRYATLVDTLLMDDLIEPESNAPDNSQKSPQETP